MNSTKWIVVIVLAVLGLFLLTKSSNKENGGVINLGFIAPLTGDAANIGQNAKAAVEVAVEEINASGGVDGKTVNVIYEDGKCTGKDAANAASKLINADKVSVILGGACSGETSAFTGLAEQTKTVVLSYCSSAPAITNAGDYIFRNYPSDTFQGSYAAEYLKNTLNKSKVAVMYVKSDWGVGIKDVFKERFTALGGSIVAEEGYEQTAREFRTTLSKLKTSGADVIYFLGYTEASIPALKQAKELAVNLQFFGGDAWDDSKIWTDAGASGEGAMYTVVSANPSDSFKSALAKKVGSSEVGVCSPTAYDAMHIIAKVIAEVGNDSVKIKDALYKINYTGGVSSESIKFDQNGDLVGANYIVKKVAGGVASEIK